MKRSELERSLAVSKERFAELVAAKPFILCFSFLLMGIIVGINYQLSILFISFAVAAYAFVVILSEKNDEL